MVCRNNKYDEREIKDGKKYQRWVGKLISAKLNSID